MLTRVSVRVVATTTTDADRDFLSPGTIFISLVHSNSNSNLVQKSSVELIHTMLEMQNNLFDPGHEITVSLPHTKPNELKWISWVQGRNVWENGNDKKKAPQNTSNYIKNRMPHICTRTQHVKKTERQDKTRATENQNERLNCIAFVL